MTELIANALEPVIRALRSDGYNAELTDANGILHFLIVATPEACEDCLSPKPVIGGMIAQLLSKHGIAREIDLTYPNEHGVG